MKSLFLIVTIFCSIDLFAQDKDSLQTLERFARICRSYQQLPLHAQVNVETRSNLPSAGEDTGSKTLDFYLLEEGSYLRFGALEELISDSQALMISTDLKRMILYNGAHDLTARTRGAMGPQIDEASIGRLSKTCLVYQGNNVITVTSRSILPDINQPSGSIELQYDGQSQQPQKITQVKRSLVAVDSSAYAQLRSADEWKGKLKDIPGKGFFALREETIVFTYRKIEHGADIRVPARIADRIAKTAAGRYEPVAAYQNFLLTQD